MASVKLSNLCKKFPNGFEAVKGMSLEIRDKEFVVFVGPSGCGKSTTLRMIAGLEEVSDGEIEMDGKTINSIAPKNRDIAMVFQNYSLYPHMTVYKNMSFGLALRKTPKQEIERRVHEAAKMLGIENLLSRKPKQLSGGERQRVAMGRAIVREPKVFLMDEPLSNLDAKLRTQMREEIAKLYHKLNTTFIYVTHDQTEAMTLGTRIIVMKDGIIQQADTPQNLYNNPANLFVAGFIGTPKMNFFEMKATNRNNTICLEYEGYTCPLETKRSMALLECGYADKNLIVGIRPQHIFINNNIQGNHTMFASIELVEHLGSEMYLHLKSLNKTFTVCVEPELKVAIGDAVQIVFDFNKVHIFNKETGLAV